MELQNFLEENKIWHRFINKPETIHTKDASLISGIDLHQLTKSLVLFDENNCLFLSIIPGDCKLNMEKIKSALKVKSLRLVPFEEAQNYSGYLPGATPMIFHKSKMKVILDKQLLSYENIYGGGGSRDRLLELKTSDVITLNNALVEDICE